ncbi:PAS domain S-box protein [Oceanimonas sp. NS1]|nr:PAS domain S-box protein [Oceanimonas sp. NS1]
MEDGLSGFVLSCKLGNKRIDMSLQDATFRYIDILVSGRVPMFSNGKLKQELLQYKEQNQHFSALLRAIRAHVAVIEFTPDGEVLNVNEDFLKVVGYTLEQVKGKHHQMFCEPGLVASPEYQTFWQRLRAGEHQQGTFPRITHDGRKIWLQATYFPVQDETGRVLKILKIASDITEKQHQLIRQQAVLTALDRSMAVIEFKVDGTVLSANDNFLSLMGYHLEQVVGQHHRLFLR